MADYGELTDSMEMARIDFAANHLRNLPITSVLDVGCRGADLRDQLPAAIEYSGADLYPDSRGLVRYVGDISSLSIEDRFDAVVALDILEHLESPSKAFDKLVELSRRYIFVSFPNTYDLRSRFRFAVKGQLGGKYRFREEESLDRHRWVMNRDEVLAFYHAKACKHGLSVRTVDMCYGQSGLGTPTACIGRVLTMLLPRDLSSQTIFGIFEKRLAAV